MGEGDPFVDFRTDPSRYRHIRLAVDGAVATLTLDVDEGGSIFPGCELKLNSYDLGVDIEIADAVQRLRFEHPEVRVVLLRSGKDRVFCAGANIRMLATASHRHKVNFCKFTNETRLAIEDASEHSGQKYIAVITGTAAGGGYEFALAADHIILVDDGSATVSLPEVPLLAVLPGTGGLTRLVDKRGVRRDLADVFCTTEEGVKGKRAVDWRLVDEAVPRSQLEHAIARCVAALTEDDKGSPRQGVPLTPLERTISGEGVAYEHVQVVLDRELRTATIAVSGPTTCPDSFDALVAEGAEGWMLRCARELDDAILHLRFNEPDVATVVFKTVGDSAPLLRYERMVTSTLQHWFARELTLLWQRVLKRIDLTSRSLVTLVEPGSCFAGVLAELVFAADRSYMLIGSFAEDERPPAQLTLTFSNRGQYCMGNGLSRLGTRFLGDDRTLQQVENDHTNVAIEAEEAANLGLVTFALDDIDWEDEIRLFLEERASFSPDALTAMEANLRFAGPETMETKIFARLTAWQNWVFQRPNAVGTEGALKRYGTGQRPIFDTSRV